MTAEQAIKTGVGLRHILEDGISILEGTHLEKARRDYVLDDLEALFGEVVRGSELVQARSLFIGTNDRKAFESFSLLDKFLPEIDEEMDARLKALVASLTELKIGNTISDEQASELSAFLNQILAGLNRQDSAGLPNEPEQVNILSL